MRQVVDHQLPAQLAVQRTQPRRHESREIALDDPLLQRRRARCRLNDVQQPRPCKVSHLALMMNIIHQDIEKREIPPLRPPRKLIPTTAPRPCRRIIARLPLMVAQLLRQPMMFPRIRIRTLEPRRQDLRIQPDLGSDVESELHHPRLGVQAQAHAVDTCDAHEEVREAGGEGRVFCKGLFFAFDEGGEEEDSFFDNPFVMGGCCDLADGDINLLQRGVLNTWMGKGAA